MIGVCGRLELVDGLAFEGVSAAGTGKDSAEILPEGFLSGPATGEAAADVGAELTTTTGAAVTLDCSCESELARLWPNEIAATGGWDLAFSGGKGRSDTDLGAATTAWLVDDASTCVGVLELSAEPLVVEAVSATRIRRPALRSISLPIAGIS
jgi:hypothetical protein